MLTEPNKSFENKNNEQLKYFYQQTPINTLLTTTSLEANSLKNPFHQTQRVSKDKKKKKTGNMINAKHNKAFKLINFIKPKKYLPYTTLKPKSSKYKRKFNKQSRKKKSIKHSKVSSSERGKKSKKLKKSFTAVTSPKIKKQMQNKSTLSYKKYKKKSLGRDIFNSNQDKRSIKTIQSMDRKIIEKYLKSTNIINMGKKKEKASKNLKNLIKKVSSKITQKSKKSFNSMKSNLKVKDYQSYDTLLKKNSKKKSNIFIKNHQ